MITYDIDRLPQMISVGVQGENGVQPVRINAASWLSRWPDMQLTVWATLPGGKAAYQAQSHMEDAVLVWDVTSADTSVQGVGTAEIVGVSDTKVKKTGPIRTSICKTSTIDTTSPPEQQQPWYTAALDALRRAEELVAFGAEYAGQILAVGADGSITPLKLGEGLEIVDGVLRVTYTPAPDEPEIVAFVQQDDGSVLMQGTEFVQQDDGSTLWAGAEFAQQDDGSVLIK